MIRFCPWFWHVLSRKPQKYRSFGDFGVRVLVESNLEDSDDAAMPHAFTRFYALFHLTACDPTKQAGCERLDGGIPKGALAAKRSHGHCISHISPDMCNSGKGCDVIIALIAGDHAEFAIICDYELDRFGMSTRNGSSQKTVQRRRVNHLSRLHFIFKQFPTAAKVAARWRVDWWWCIWLFCASSVCRKTKHSWTKQAFHQTLETRPLEVSESASSQWWDGFECFDSCFCPWKAAPFQWNWWDSLLFHFVAKLMQWWLHWCRSYPAGIRELHPAQVADVVQEVPAQLSQAKTGISFHLKVQDHLDLNDPSIIQLQLTTIDNNWQQLATVDNNQYPGLGKCPIWGFWTSLSNI